MKKHSLKPGRHQFAPGAPAVHSNDNLSDGEAEWYLERYPHIAALFVDSPDNGKSENPKDIEQTKPKVKRKRISKSIANPLN